MIKRCIMETRKMKTAQKLMLATLLAATCFALTACQDDAVSRTVSAPQIEESNAKRAEYIDSLQIPEEQKKAMKDRLGKPQGATEDSRGK